MNAPIVVAQASPTGSTTGTGSVRTIKVTKPANEHAVTMRASAHHLTTGSPYSGDPIDTRDYDTLDLVLIITAFASPGTVDVKVQTGNASNLSDAAPTLERVIRTLNHLR